MITPEHIESVMHAVATLRRLRDDDHADAVLALLAHAVNAPPATATATATANNTATATATATSQNAARCRAYRDRKRSDPEHVATMLDHVATMSPTMSNHVTDHVTDHVATMSNHVKSMSNHVTDHVATCSEGGVGGVSFAVAVPSLNISNQEKQRQQQQPLSPLTDLVRTVIVSPTMSPTMSPSSRLALFETPTLAPIKHDLIQRRRSGDEIRSVRRALAETVFVYWQHRLGHDRALFDEKRQRRIEQRLQENSGDASELCYAIDGLFKSRWHRDQKQTGIEVVFRDREQVESFLTRYGTITDPIHSHVRNTTQALLGGAS